MVRTAGPVYQTQTGTKIILYLLKQEAYAAQITKDLGYAPSSYKNIHILLQKLVDEGITETESAEPGMPIYHKLTDKGKAIAKSLLMLAKVK